MEDVVCGVSAFRYHRTPPVVLSLYPPVGPFGNNHWRKRAVRSPFVEDIMGAPLHILAFSRSERTGAPRIRQHLVSWELPLGATLTDEALDISVTSPCMTLFTLARSVSDAHLLMAMYEMCGSFTVFRPSQQAAEMLARHGSALPLGADGGWTQVCDVSGKPTNLWRRPPLVGLRELLAFARETEHLRGGKRFARTVAKVTGVTASPFEVQLSMLLGLSRSEGGEGLAGFVNNHEIRLTRDARLMAGRARAYADLYYEGEGPRAPLAIECQGGIVHSGDAAAMADADRTTALQGMGIDVLPLTYRQITDAGNFRRVVRVVAKKLGRPSREKSARLLAREAELRHDLFIDWLTLGT